MTASRELHVGGCDAGSRFRPLAADLETVQSVRQADAAARSPSPLRVGPRQSPHSPGRFVSPSGAGPWDSSDAGSYRCRMRVLPRGAAFRPAQAAHLFHSRFLRRQRPMP